MMNYKKPESLEFRQIVLKHLQRILEISSKELRDSSRLLIGSNFNQTIEQEDTRYSYVQSIENLAYVLMPYFDDQMKDTYNNCINVINAYNFKLKKVFEEEIKEFCKSLGKEEVGEVYFLNKKIEYSKQLFVGLNLLLKRNDYLKSSIYGEERDEIAEDSSEDDE